MHLTIRAFLWNGVLFEAGVYVNVKFFRSNIKFESETRAGIVVFCYKFRLLAFLKLITRREIIWHRHTHLEANPQQKYVVNLLTPSVSQTASAYWKKLQSQNGLAYKNRMNKSNVIMKLIHSAASKCLCLTSPACSAHIATNIVDGSERWIKITRTLISPKPV